MSRKRILGCVSKHKAVLLSRKKEIKEAATIEKNEAGDSVLVNPIDLDVTADATAKPRKRSISKDNDDTVDERPQPTMTTGKISHSFVKC